MLIICSIITRIAQLMGVLVLVFAALLTVAFLSQGDKLASLLCATVTLASIGYILLAGLMRKRMRVWSEKFPSSVR